MAKEKIKKVSLTVYVREDEEPQLIADLNYTFCNNDAMLWGGLIESVDMDPAHPDAETITTFLHPFDEETDNA